MEEVWKDIKGYEGLYQVSNLGRVKSLERTSSLNRKTSKTLCNRICRPFFRYKWFYQII